MNESIIIRLGSRYQDAVSWLVWSEVSREVIASGELVNAGALSTLAMQAVQRSVIVLVPGCDVIFRELHLPGRLNAHTQHALRFMLEEQVGSDVETLHLVVLAQQGQQVHIAAVEQTLMQEWLDWLTAAGLRAAHLIPDVLALPQPASGVWSLVQLGEQWLIRQSAYSGTVVDNSWLMTWLAAQSLVPILHSASPIPECQPDHDWQVTLCKLPLQQLAEHLAVRQGDLLQGAYRSVAPWKKQLAVWRWPMALSALWLLLVVLNQGLVYQQTRQQQRQLQQQMSSVYRQLFPQETRVVNPPVQLKQHLAALQQTPLKTSFLNQLGALAPLLQPGPDFRLTQLHFDADKHAFSLQINAKAFQQLQQVKDKAADSFNVDISNMQEQGGQVSGTLLIRSKS